MDRWIYQQRIGNLPKWFLIYSWSILFMFVCYYAAFVYKIPVGFVIDEIIVLGFFVSILVLGLILKYRKKVKKWHM